MKHSVVNYLPATFLFLFFCPFLAGPLQAQAPPTEPQAQATHRTARISDVRGNLALRGEDEDDFSYAERNTVTRAHDTLWTSEESYGEIELEGGTWLRLAADTKLEIR